MTAAEYRAAVEELDRLWATDHAGAARRRMETLLGLIEDYERMHVVATSTARR